MATSKERTTVETLGTFKQVYNLQQRIIHLLKKKVMVCSRKTGHPITRHQVIMWPELPLMSWVCQTHQLRKWAHNELNVSRI